MAGTLANPVILDPFQVITEVSWNAVRYVAFRVTLAESREYSTTQSCASPVAMPSGTFHDVHLTSASYSYASGVAVQETAIYRNDAWVSDDVTVNGLPADPGSFTYTDWEVIAAPPVQGHGRWVGFGTVTEIPTPSGDFFQLNIPNFEIYGDRFIGGPFCGDLSRIWAESTNTNDESISPTSFPPSGTRAVYKGREYTPIGAKLFNESQPDNPGTVWVLCERL